MDILSKEGEILRIYKAFLISAFLLSFVGIAFSSQIEVLNVGLPGDVKALDPMQAVDTISSSVAKHILEPLMTVDGMTKKIVPVLAERWEILDPQTYKFYLRRGVKFHNGDPFTAEDVVYTFKRAISSASLHAPRVSPFLNMDDFEILDDYTVILRTKGPVGGWLESMKYPYANIMSKRAVEESGETYFRNPVGTGPFKFKNWTKGEKIELTAFDGYYGSKPNVKDLNFLVLPDDSSRVIALETGNVDFAYAVPPSDVDRLNGSSSKVKAVEGQGLVLIYLGMNTQKKPLDDARVRQAIDYAINKEAYNQVVYQGYSKIPEGPLVPASMFTPLGSKSYQYDPNKAKDLLKQAGYPDGFTLKLWIINFQDRINGATVVQSMLEQIGIKVEIEVFESGVFDDRMMAGGHDLFIHTWGMQTTREAGEYWSSLLHSRNIGNTNKAALQDKKLDDLLNECSVIVDQGKRNTVLQQIWERIDELHPMIGLAVPSEIFGAKKELTGLDGLCDGRINYLGNLSLVD
jgi:peptide/nickel transport system substrate-binding protein